MAAYVKDVLHTAPGSGRIGLPVVSIAVLWLSVIAFVVFLAGALIYSKTQQEQRIREYIAIVAQLSAERIGLTFDMVDQVLLTVRDELAPDDFSPEGNRARRNDVLESLQVQARKRNRNIASLTLLDNAGLPVASTSAAGNGNTAPPELSAMLATETTSKDQPVISEAQSDPVTGILGIRMIRRVDHSDGRLAGFLVAHIDLDRSIVRFGQSLAFNNNDLISLRNSRHNLLAGYPTQKDPFSGTSGATLLGQAFAADEPAGVAPMRSPVDNVSRLVAYRKLPGYPLYVAYGKAVDSLQASWRQEILVAACAALFALTVGAIITIGIRRRVHLTSQLEVVRGHLIDSNHALRSALAASEINAAHDQLTGLWNRRAFDHRLEEAVARIDRHEGRFSLLLIDLDHFKGVNDHYGHVVGDEVLKRFADVLHERLRQNDVDARWGGEEFAVLADGASLDNAFALAEHIRQAIEDTPFEKPPQVTVSIGVAEFQTGDSADSLLARADDALYEAKRTGRNRVVAASGLMPGERLFIGSTGPAPLFAEMLAGNPAPGQSADNMLMTSH